MKIEMLEGMVKARKGNYVVYDIDYLMEHLAKEVCLLQRYRVNKQRCKQLDYEAVLKEVREGMFAKEIPDEISSGD